MPEARIRADGWSRGPAPRPVPVAPTPTPTPPASTPAARRETAPEPPAARAAGHLGTTVVVAVDDRSLALGLAQMCLTLGLEVVEIKASEADALAAVERHRPDLLLTDVHLAGAGDGTRLAAACWAEWGTRAILMCQAVDCMLMARSVGSGIIGFLPRPTGTAVRGLTLIEVQNALAADRCRILPGPALSFREFVGREVRQPAPNQRPAPLPPERPPAERPPLAARRPHAQHPIPVPPIPAPPMPVPAPAASQVLGGWS